MKIVVRVSHSFWKSVSTFYLRLPDKTFWLPGNINAKTYNKTFGCPVGQPGVNFWLPDRNKWLPQATGQPVMWNPGCKSIHEVIVWLFNFFNGSKFEGFDNANFVLIHLENYENTTQFGRFYTPPPWNSQILRYSPRKLQNLFAKSWIRLVGDDRKMYSSVRRSTSNIWKSNRSKNVWIIFSKQYVVIL